MILLVKNSAEDASRTNACWEKLPYSQPEPIGTRFDQTCCQVKSLTKIALNMKGKIGVTSENLFPIIKKFLYSDHDIFLREIVSNAVDATQKLKTLASAGKYSGQIEALSVKVSIDRKSVV